MTPMRSSIDGHAMGGTGKNIFGKSMLWEHESPGAVYMLEPEILRLWIQQNDAKTIRELYDLLVSDDQEKIQKRITEIFDEVLEYNQ